MTSPFFPPSSPRVLQLRDRVTSLLERVGEIAVCDTPPPGYERMLACEFADMTLSYCIASAMGIRSLVVTQHAPSGDAPVLRLGWFEGGILFEEFVDGPWVETVMTMHSPWKM
jgi:hypothetical protein